MIEDTLNEIFSYRTLTRRENIDDLRLVYSLLGNPCKNIKTIHIAGTNGKGSTASFIENIFFAAGYNVGKFTSPHILKYNERIVFNGEIIPDEEIIQIYNIVKDTINRYNYKTEEHKKIISLNFFEITTFIALLFFEKQNPDFIILETGLGGRLDATNIVDSDISIITNISFDHTGILGNSLKEISYEKAGIIKNNQLCIYSDSLPELTEEIRKKTHCSINVVQKYENMNIELDKKNYKTLVELEGRHFIIPLFGKFQAYNFLAAYEAAKIYNIDDITIQKGLDSVYWPARFEIFSNDPHIILDAAHNDNSIEKLTENLRELYRKDEIIIITSLLSTKDFRSVFEKLEDISDKIYVTSLKDIVYGLTSEEIREKMILLDIPIENIVFQDDISVAFTDALNIISNGTPSKTGRKYKAIVVCGSFYEISKFRIINSNKNNSKTT